MTSETLRSHFADLSDEALHDILAKPQDYTPQALELAHAEAAQRRLSERSSQSFIVRSEPSVINNFTRAKGSRWLGVVGLLSLGNTVLVAFGSTIIFVVGLGITQLVDVFFAKASPSLRAFAVTFSVLCAGVFLFLQYFARASRRALMIGICLYAADTVIILILGWWQGLAFHLILLVLMIRGLKSSAYQPQADTSAQISTM